MAATLLSYDEVHHRMDLHQMLWRQRGLGWRRCCGRERVAEGPAARCCSGEVVANGAAASGSTIESVLQTELMQQDGDLR